MSEIIRLTPDDYTITSFEFQNTQQEDFQLIMKLINDNLSEPYSIYVYRFFINNWPKLCHLARLTTTNEIIGVIISKIESHRLKKQRGYIGMLTISSPYRSNGIAKKLINININEMIDAHCDEIMLETEVVNVNLLNLYENFGFLRVKRLYRYYLNTHDAYRLILPITENSTKRSTFLDDLQSDQIPIVKY